MELDFYSINSLKTMEVIDVITGSRIGYIKDFKIDINEYRIISIILPSQKMSLFNKINDIEIPWEQIKKVGVDVILVHGDEYMNIKE